MFTAPDGTQWYTGVRWFYDGAYHKKPQRNKPRRKGIYSHVFASVNDPRIRYTYTMQPGDQVRCNAVELARRFAHSYLTASDTTTGREDWKG